MTENENSDGCASIAALSVAVVLLIGIILFLTQKADLINCFGEEFAGKIVHVDSVHTRYYKYEFQYNIKLSNNKFIKVAEGNFKTKTHQIGEDVKIKTYNNESEFKTQSPNLYILIPLICVLGLFIRVYFVFR